MNLFEKAIAAVSPRMAAQRAYFRNVVDMQARAYEAAKSGRRVDGWYSPRTSANAEIGPAADQIRARVHDLVRNNPHAAPIPRKWASKIVGTGIQPRLKTPDDADENVKLRTAARGIWERFVDNSDQEGQVDFYTQQFLAACALTEAGEVLFRMVRNGSRSGKYPLQIQVLEGDYLDGQKNQALEGGGAIIQGVQYSSEGTRVGYWLFDEHPGDLNVFTRRALRESKFVPASEVDHIFDAQRPGQARGVSMFAPVALLLRDIDDWKDAERMRKKISACFVGFVKKAAGPAASPLGQGQGKNQSGQIGERFSPGMLTYLQQGEEVEFGEPPQDSGQTDYLISELHTVAHAVGLPFSTATGILSEANFAGMRVGHIDFLDLLDHMQHHVMVPRGLRRVWNRVGQIAAVTGQRKVEDPWTPRWIMPPRRMLDPQKEVVATKDAVRSLQNSPFDAMGSASGYDPEEIIADVKRFNKLVDDAGIVTDMDPRRVAAQSAPSVTAVVENEK